MCSVREFLFAMGWLFVVFACSAMAAVSLPWLEI